MAMVPRGRSSSLPVIYVAGLQRVNPEIDPEAERGPAAVGRRKSRRPSVLDALVPKGPVPAAPGPERDSVARRLARALLLVFY